MFLVELVMQGVRGFQQLVRLRFQGGFNFIAAGNEAGKTTSVDSMVRLLFPVNEAAKMNVLVSRSAPEGSRGALVVYSDDGSYYRVIQDFSKAAVNLSKYNAPTKEFILQNKDWDSTGRFMEGLLPGIAEEEYARLFVFRRDAGDPGVAPAPSAVSSVARPAVARVPAGRTAVQDAKLAELREALRKAEEAADADYKAEAARMKLTEIAKKLERLDESASRAAEVEAHLAELKAFENLPADIDELLQNHEQAEAEVSAKTNDLLRDIEGLTIQRDMLPTANMMTDKLFIAGVGVGALAFIAGIFILSDEQAIFFPILILAAFLLVAAGWYNSSRKNAQRGAVQKEIDELTKERALIEKKFKEQGASVPRLIEATKATSSAELKEKADNYKYFLSLQTDIQEQQRMALGGLRPEDVRQEYEKQQEELAPLEQAAKALSGRAMGSDIKHELLSAIMFLTSNPIALLSLQ